MTARPADGDTGFATTRPWPSVGDGATRSVAWADGSPTGDEGLAALPTVWATEDGAALKDAATARAFVAGAIGEARIEEA